MGSGPITPSAARALLLPGAFAAALLTIAFSNSQHPQLFPVLLGVSAFLLLWMAGLFAVVSRADDRTLTIELALRKNHWVQLLAQVPLYVYWGWHERFVYDFVPLFLAQLVFAYGVDILLTWSRGRAYVLGLGPCVIVLSINLFLWFRPEWFVWQFVMIALGYAAKEFLRWIRNGRSAHVFNPSSFPLAVFSLALILAGASNITYGEVIANSQFDVPYMYLAIFLVALPGQILFGVTRMTLSAVVTMYAIGVLYLNATGTYLFFDAYIPVPVFLGMHLLFTDPSTSPSSELGRILFGVLYALGIVGCFLLLTRLDLPTFYDKLLPVPIINLLVRHIDRLAAWRPLSVLDPARLGRGLAPQMRNLVYASVWAVVFVAMSAGQAVGDKHPGQYLPFWTEACAAGSGRACDYEQYLTLAYCMNGSGWACNETGILLTGLGRAADAIFERGCAQGFSEACMNAERPGDESGPLARAGPTLPDLPIILRGTKPTLRGRTPGELYALACEQGWGAVCEQHRGDGRR